MRRRRNLRTHIAGVFDYRYCERRALDRVGAEYEAGRVFLPQLLMAAEAAKSAFEKIKESFKENQDRKLIMCKCLEIPIN